MLLYMLYKRYRARRAERLGAERPEPHHPGGAAGLLLHQMRYETLAFLRDRRASFFTLAFPLLLLVLYGFVFDGTFTDDGRKIEWMGFWVPALAALGIVASSFLGVVMAVTRERENGVLKRRRATPAPPWVLIGGRSLSLLSLSLVIVLVLTVVGRVAYGVELPLSSIPGVVLGVIVGSASLCAVGYAFSTLVGSVESAMPMTQILVLPLYFVSGVFVPTSSLPSWVHTVGEIFPIAHVSGALHHAFQHSGGLGISWTDLAVLAGWGVVGLAIAARRFSWMPRAAPA